MNNLERAFEETDRYVQNRMSEVNMPGLVVAVTDRQETLRVTSYGHSDLSARTPMQPDLMFEIGSIGKSFTNVALLQLRDEGKLNLQAPVSQYLPWFEVESDYGPITSHHLMSHTSGLPSGNDIGTHGLYESWALRHMRTGSPPGECFRYSNVGYKTLGFLLEEVDGRSYSEAIQARVLDRLGMRDSHPVTGFETRKRSPVGYRSFYDDRPEHRDHGLVPALWTEYGVGDGCQASSPADMCVYLRVLMNGGAGPSGRVLSEASYGLMTQRVIATQQWGGAWYGYGLTMADIDGHSYLGHGGSTPGFMAAMIADLDEGVGVVVLINGNVGSYGAVNMALHVLRILRAGILREDMPPGPSATDQSLVSNAGDYTGTYGTGEDRMVVAARDGKLMLHRRGKDIALERRGEDSFYVAHPDLELFLLEFGRRGDKVVELYSGPDRYARGGHCDEGAVDFPAEWESYTGHYRTYNFVLTNFRVILRRGQLLLVYPNGGHDVLVPLEDGRFRVGEDPRVPETISFDSATSGKTLRAVYSGCPYYRTYTP